MSSVKVYLLDVDCYENRHIAGVYATPKAAMKAAPVPENPRTLEGRTPGWTRDEYRDDAKVWTNNCDWEDAARIVEFEVET